MPSEKDRELTSSADESRKASESTGEFISRYTNSDKIDNRESSGEENEAFGTGGGIYKIQIKDGLTICTPDDLNLLTPYVLLENEEWFEPEIEFVREYLKPGMNAIDTGAGFGVYALPMAKKVGSEGKVTAFEPGSIAGHHLEMSKIENRADNLEISGCAVSDQTGNTGLQIGETPEMNRLGAKGSEEISMVTLDSWWDFEGRPNVDFIKLDVNGGESRVIIGAENLLSETSPVILFNRGESGQYEAITERLKKQGYRQYEYIPGLKLLTLHDDQPGRDPYLTNVVAMKERESEAFRRVGGVFNESIKPDEPEAGIWEGHLQKFPWTDTLFSNWKQHAQSLKITNYLRALDYACAAEQVKVMNAADPDCRSEKASLLLESAKLLIQLYNRGSDDLSVVFTLVRVLNLLGKRGQAVEILKNSLEATRLGLENMNVDLPFLPPLAEQDAAPVRTDFTKWLKVRMVESWILLKDDTTFRIGEKETKMLKILDGNPEVLPRVEKRFAFVALKNNIELDQEQRIRLAKIIKAIESGRLAGPENGKILKGPDPKETATFSVNKVPSKIKRRTNLNKNDSEGFHIPSRVVRIKGHEVSWLDLYQEIWIPEREIFRIYNIFSKHEYALPKNLKLRKNATVLDIGANVGIFALYAHQWAENVQIHSFEPNPQVHSLLDLNTASLKNITRHQFAMGNGEGELVLYQHPVNTGQASTTYRFKGAKKVKVPVQNAGNVVRKLDVNIIDVLKIDTEGAEVSILEGLKHYLKKTRYVMAEYHTETDRKKIDELLSDFMIYSVHVDGLRGVGTVKYINMKYLEELKTS